MLKIKNNFNLKSTITCGQIFRYFVEDNKYTIILKDRVISLEEKDNYIIVKSNNEENLEKVINDYFDLSRNYSDIEKNILKCDSKLKDALIYSRGLKMIHQDPFETIISYVISQNNRVPSIANSLNLLALNYGKKVVFDNKEYYLFPTLNDLKKLKQIDYRNCKVGFRDKYLYELVQNITDENIINICNMNSDEALNYLIGFKGIGHKVASCILLFAYQIFDVFPIDTWVKKYMKDEYKIEGEKNIREYTKKTYKEYSGLAIQYMFNYKRNKN